MAARGKRRFRGTPQMTWFIVVCNFQTLISDKRVTYYGISINCIVPLASIAWRYSYCRKGVTIYEDDW